MYPFLVHSSRKKGKKYFLERDGRLSNGFESPDRWKVDLLLHVIFDISLVRYHCPAISDDIKKVRANEKSCYNAGK